MAGPINIAECQMCMKTWPAAECAPPCGNPHCPVKDSHRVVTGLDTHKKYHDPVNHPKHYTDHPSGVECIEITRHMGFNLGNAIKYIWRADLKNGLEDLEKAVWYLTDELKKRRSAK